MPDIKIQPIPDVELTYVGALHMETRPGIGGGKTKVLICGDTDVTKGMATAAGVWEGGRRMVKVDIVISTVILPFHTVDPTLGGALAEPTEAVG